METETPKNNWTAAAREEFEQSVEELIEAILAGKYTVISKWHSRQLEDDTNQVKAASFLFKLDHEGEEFIVEFEKTANRVLECGYDYWFRSITVDGVKDTIDSMMDSTQFCAIKRIYEKVETMEDAIRNKDKIEDIKRKTSILKKLTDFKS